MKRIIFALAIALGLSFSQQSMAQSAWSKIFSGATKAATDSNNSNSGDVLGGVLNSVINEAGNAGSLLGNILSNVTGSVTTTKANLIGSWDYTEPAVQFESENLLTRAGGVASATKVEKKLVTYYKMVGIAEGRMKFNFDNDGNVTYTLGKRTFQGTYVFDENSKTVTITTSTGLTLKAYVTISGSQMSLCFDSTKVLSLFTSLSAAFNKTVSAVSGQYSGMKTGFKFTKVN